MADLSNEVNIPDIERTEAARSEQHQIRLEKLQNMRAEGKSPYDIVRFDVEHASAQILSNFDSMEGAQVVIAGRMMSRRIMGKASFVHLLDGEGQIQVYVRRDDIGEAEYEAFKDYDIGDIIGVNGHVFRTRAGEISVHAQKLTLLTKSLHPLPEKWHGLRDTDTRYRQRYLDLIVNPQVRDTFRTRSRVIKAIRGFLDARGYLEVDTPILGTHELGAAARPFKTHLNALDLPMFLRIETELYLKRLIVGGFERVYEVGRIFRNEGMDATHNPEFTTVEMYQAYTDYRGMMDLIEEMFIEITREVHGGTDIVYQGETIHMGGPWRRVTMAQLVKGVTGIDYYAWQDDAQARAQVKAAGYEPEAGFTRGECLNLLFEEAAEQTLLQPTFVCDYPIEISPLARRKADEPMLTERFEFFIARHEYGNAFSELNDPADQRARFERQVAAKRAQGIDARLDEDFIAALECGLPPTGGLGFGVDRLVMLMTDCGSIRDVLLFPTMKPRE